MKKFLTFLSLALLAAGIVTAQTPSGQSGEARRALTRFNLDFPGGTPGELAAAIQKALGRPLNVVVPTEYASTTLPPLKMNGVNVAQLFKALGTASRRKVYASYGGRTFSQAETVYGFDSGPEATLNDDSIWTFIVTGTPQLPKVARFYLLAPYLQAGLTVDDITTALQTSWKMLDQKDRPSLSFHQETKLLIAVGYDSELATIEAALKTLDAMVTKPAPALVPGDEKKTKP